MNKPLKASAVLEKDAAVFRKAVDAYAKKVAKDKKSARAALVKMGIYTKGGNLTTHYKK